MARMNLCRSTITIMMMMMMIIIIMMMMMMIIIKNLFKVGYNNIVYSMNRATNSNQLFTKIQYLQFQLITDITVKPGFHMIVTVGDASATYGNDHCYDHMKTTL